MKASGNPSPSKLSKEFAARLESTRRTRSSTPWFCSSPPESRDPLNVMVLVSAGRRSALFAWPVDPCWSIWMRFWRNSAVDESMMT